MIVVSCHPTLPFVAIANANDTVLLYDLARGDWSLPRLSHASQHRISCAQWEPMQPTSLAVGCAGGVCLWGLSFSEEAAAGGSGGARLAVTGAYLVRVLAHPPGAPVSSLSWCPFGGQLASASREHAAILVWESSSGHHEQLWFKSGGGCAAVSWAPAAGAYVCALGVDGPVRVWESMSWRWETLRLGSGAHAAALGHAHGALPSLLSGAFAPKPVGAASRTAAGRGAAASPAFSAAVWSADGGALLLLPRHGPLLRYVVLRQSPPLIQPIDGGAHMLPVGPLGYAVHHDSALGEPPHERPALTLRPVGERARAAAAQGWEVARAQIDELLRASAGLGAAPEVEHLPGSPSGCVAVVRFRDVRAREHFAALVGGGGGWGGGGGVGGSGGTAEAQASGRGGGMEGAPAEWECVRCTSVSHVRHAVWDGAAERMAVCTQEELMEEVSSSGANGGGEGQAAGATLQARCLAGSRAVHVLQTRLHPVLQLTALGELSSLPSADCVRVPGSFEGRRGQAEDATGPDVVGFARAPDGKLLLVMAWETGELALVPSL